MKAQWRKADEYTQECFDKYGFNGETALYTATLKNPAGVTCDLTILKKDNKYIPCHGAIRMAATKTIKKAKIDALNWFDLNMVC